MLRNLPHESTHTYNSLSLTRGGFRGGGASGVLAPPSRILSGGSTLQCAQAQQHVITINWTTLNRAPCFWCVRILCCDGLSQIMTHIIMSGSLAPPPLEKSCIRPCLQPLMLIFWCIWRENTRAGQVAAGWIDGACGPDIMLKFTGCRGPDRQSSRAGFGPRAGLCRPLL